METKILEYRILSLLRNRDYYLKYNPVIKENLFESPQVRYLYRLLLYYHKRVKAKKLAPISSLYTLVNARAKPNESKQYKEIIAKVKKYKFNDEAIADTIVKTFAKKAILKLTILDAVDSLKKADDVDIERLRTRLDEALLVDSAGIVDDAYDYLSNPIQRLQEDKEEPRIPTLLSPDLDSSLRGGLGAGEIAIAVGPTTVGKTMFLINLGYNAMKMGKKIVYVTLELSGRRIAGRFDQLVCKKPYDVIRDNPQIVMNAIRKLSRNGSGLRIKDATSTKMSPIDLSVYLERLRKDFEFDMVLVDQVDLMYSPKEYKERRHELSSIVVALRRMGSNFGIPVWTASQATRQAGAEGETTMWDIAEDIGKANWSDVILTLSQSEQDKEEDILFAHLAKNRIGSGNPKVLLKTDYPTMRLIGETDIKIDGPKKKKKVRKRNED